MNFKGIVSLTGYAVLIGSVGFFARMVEGLDLMNIVFFRALLAAGFVFCITAFGGSAKLLWPNNWLGLGLVALSQGCMMICFIGATLHTTIANAVFITYTAPVFAILFSWLFLGETISRTTIISFLLTAAGVLLIVDVNSFSLGAETLYGDVLAFGAGISYAAVTVSSKYASRTDQGQTIVFWQMGLVALCLLPFIDLPSPAVVLNTAPALLGLGIVATGCSWLLFMHGIRYVAGQQALIITSLETVIPAGFAWFIFGESLSSTALAGCAMILIGVLWVQISDLRSEAIEGEGLAPAMRFRPVSGN